MTLRALQLESFLQASPSVPRIPQGLWGCLPYFLTDNIDSRFPGPEGGLSLNSHLGFVGEGYTGEDMGIWGLTCPSGDVGGPGQGSAPFDSQHLLYPKPGM